MATVLIVEDQEQILTLAQSFLEEQGHKTLSAATADEALAILTGSLRVPIQNNVNEEGVGQLVFELLSRFVNGRPRTTNQARIEAPMRNSAIAMNQSATTHTYMLIGRLHFWTL